MIHSLLYAIAATCIITTQLHSDVRIPRLEAYITAQQVDKYLSTPQDRTTALSVYQDIGITKVYLESLRSGYQVDSKQIQTVRDFFLENGIEVSGGITTTSGENFGAPSNRNRYWLNYQEEKTQQALSAHIKKIAPLYKEIIIDDFFATDDESALSKKAKGEQSWPKYRLHLMADFARRYIIQPAKQVNPEIQLIEKFPQWYDRFHIFGYNIEEAPMLFDRVWVGTETRNPNTKRFGFVMPTEGYINYRWIASIAGEKIGGGWFDFGDCTPQTYLMQAYQSILAGAQELVLFETGSLFNKNKCIEAFTNRRDALHSLGKILQSKKPNGMYAYKPINSDGSDGNGAANLYIYDYIATLGLAPIPVADVPEDARCIFLSRHAADDSDIAEKMNRWLERNQKLFVTPDFLNRINDPSIHEQINVEELPIFSAFEIKNNKVWIINLQTFRHEEFGPEKEMFLPPRPLPVTDWPESVVNTIRKEVLQSWGIEFEAPNNVGFYLYDEDCVAIANFNDRPIECSPLNLNDASKPFHRIVEFSHHEGVRLNEGSICSLTVPPWEIAILTR